MFKKIRVKKGLAVFISAIFSYSAVAGNFAYAAANAEDVVKNITSPEIVSDDTFKNYARVVSSADFGGDTVVLNIQDLHMEPSVQKNIGSAIDVLVKDYGVKNVYVEGGYGKVNVSAFSKIKNKDAKILNALLEDGLITGTEYYAALNDKSDFLIGIEDEKLHKENIVRLGELISKRSFYESKISDLRKDLSFMQKKYFGAKNIKLENLAGNYRAGKISSPKYYKKLISVRNKNYAQSSGKYGATMPFDINEYPNICLYLYADKLSKNVNYAKVNKEILALISRLKEDMSFAQYKSLLERTDNFQDTYLLVSELSAQPKEFKDKYFTPELSKLLDMQDKFRRINPVELISEERFLLEDIRVTLSLNKAELEISFLSDFSLYFEDYLKASISAGDYGYFEQKFDKFLTLWGKYSFYNQMKGLEADFRLLKDYYSANDKRNEIFLNAFSENASFENKNSQAAVFNEPLAKLLAGKKNIIAVVTGGYHSEGLSGLLNAKRVSYAVVTPNVAGGVKEAHENYEIAAAEQARIFSQALQLSLFAQVLSHSINSGANTGEIAGKLFMSAVKTLSGVPYSKENVDALLGALNEAVGDGYRYVYDEQTGYVSLQSADGKYKENFVSISAKDGNIAINDEYSKQGLKDKVFLKDYGKLISKEEMQKFVKNMETVLKVSTLNFGIEAFIPRIYGSALSLFEWAAKNGIYFNISDLNGVSFELATTVGDEVLRENPGVAKLPESIQNASARQYIKEKALKNSDFFAVQLLNEFLPINQDILEIYKAYPTSLANKILDQAEILRNGGRLDYGAQTNINKPGTAGVRGALGDRITGIDLALAQIIAQAQADLANEDIKPGEIKRPVSIVGDTRFGGTEFIKAVAGVFIANGFEVEIFDSAIPTPLVSFYTKDNGIGVNITASHNKGTDNGYKFTVDGAQVAGDYANRLMARMDKIVEAEAKGEAQVKYESPEGKYEISRSKTVSLQYAGKLLEMAAGFFNTTPENLRAQIEQSQKEGKAPRFVFEVNNGASPVVWGDVFEAFGIDENNVVMRNEGRDVTFGALTDADRGAPEPNSKNLANLRKYIESLDAMERPIFGGATDVDSDRVGTLMYTDESGQIRELTPNHIALIMAYAIAKSKGKGNFSAEDVFVRTSPSTHLLDYFTYLYGANTQAVNVGSKWIAEKINDSNLNVQLGMESSGTILFKNWIYDKDGPMANMITYLIPVITGQSYSEILNEIYTAAGYSFNFAEEKADLGKTEKEKAAVKEAAVDFFTKASKEQIAAILPQLTLADGTSAFPQDLELVSVNQSDGLYLGFRNAKTDEIRAKTGKTEGDRDDIIWLQMRASGTENAIRIYAESYDENLTAQLVNLGQQIATKGNDMLKELQEKSEGLQKENGVITSFNQALNQAFSEKDKISEETAARLINAAYDMAVYETADAQEKAQMTAQAERAAVFLFHIDAFAKEAFDIDKYKEDKELYEKWQYLDKVFKNYLDFQREKKLSLISSLGMMYSTTYGYNLDNKMLEAVGRILNDFAKLYFYKDVMDEIIKKIEEKDIIGAEEIIDEWEETSRFNEDEPELYQERNKNVKTNILKAIRQGLGLLFFMVTLTINASCQVNSEPAEPGQPGIVVVVNDNEQIRKAAREFLQGNPLPRSFIGNTSAISDNYQKNIADNGVIIYDMAALIKALLLYPKENQDLIAQMVNALSRGASMRTNADFDYNGASIAPGTGFFWKIVDVKGKWLQDQSQPITGENAWLIMAMASVHNAYKGTALGNQAYSIMNGVGKALLSLQLNSGFIVMAPKDKVSDYEYVGIDYNKTVSIENNISALQALRALSMSAAEADRRRYKAAADKLETALMGAYDEKLGYFITGLDVNSGERELKFATDCQTWMILALGSARLDELKTRGFSLNLLKKTLDLAGVKDGNGNYIGVDFISNRSSGGIVSFEWTLGFIKAAQEALKVSPDSRLQADVNSMKEYIKTQKSADGVLPYSNSTTSRETGHGWFILPGLGSLASTAWLVFMDLPTHPFALDATVTVTPAAVAQAQAETETETKTEERTSPGVVKYSTDVPEYYPGANWFSAGFTDMPGRRLSKGDFIRIGYDRTSDYDKNKPSNFLMRIVYSDGKIEYFTNSKEVADKQKKGAILMKKNADDKYYEGATAYSGTVKEIVVDFGQTTTHYRPDYSPERNENQNLNPTNDGNPRFNSLSIVAPADGKAIMQENYPKVFSWLLNGKSVYSTLNRISSIEAFDLFFRPATFIKNHLTLEDKSAARELTKMARTLLIISSVLAVSFIGFFIYIGVAWFGAMWAIAFWYAAYASVDEAHVSVDFVYVRNLADEINSYGGTYSESDLKKADYLRAFIVADASQIIGSEEKYGFKPSGLKTNDEKIIWQSSKTGRLVIFSDGAEYGDIAEKADQLIPTIINRKGENFEISPIAIDPREGAKKISRDEFGRMLVINKSYYNEILALSNGNLVEAGERIRKEEAAEKFANAKNFIMNLDKIKSNEDLKKAIEAFNKSGNGQIAVPIEFFDGKKNEDIKSLILEMSAKGTRVFASINENSQLNRHDSYNLKKALLNYGFAGYVLRDGAKTVRDYYADTDSKTIEIKDFGNEDALVKQIETAEAEDKTAVKLIDVERYLSLIDGGERDIARRVGSLVGIFGGSILNIFGTHFGVKASVDAALAFDMSSVPDLTEEDFDAAKKYIAGERGTDAAIALEQKIASVPEFNIYLARIESNIADTSDMEAASDAFIITLLKKARVKADLGKEGALGLAEKNLEDLMVISALSERDVDDKFISDFEIALSIVVGINGSVRFFNEANRFNIDDDAPVYRPEEILQRVRNASADNIDINTAAEVHFAAGLWALELHADDLNRKTPIEAATVYQLLLLYADKKREAAEINAKVSIDVNAVYSILSAA
jgi:phosphomannomutase